MAIGSRSRPSLLGGGVLSCVGDTPLVELLRLLPGAGLRVYAKLEALNPGGSLKDRPALLMLEEAIEAGRLRPDTVVIESSSGNLGVGLAQACRYLGLRFICVVDIKTTAQNVALLRAYGATIDVVSEPDPETGELLPARLRRVQELLAQHRNALWPNQYGNLANPRAHHRTMHEIVTALGGHVDLVFCALSTCGTLRGCAEYISEHGLATRLVAVDAVGSVIFDNPGGPRLIPGHGAGIRPALHRPGLADHVIHVTDRECVAGCRTLVWREAIMAGGSSGGIVAALHRLRGEIPRGATCVLLLPDRGERYLDSVYSDEWVREHLGEVPELLPEI